MFVNRDCKSLPRSVPSLFQFIGKSMCFFSCFLGIVADPAQAVYLDDLFARGVVSEEVDLVGHRGLNRMKEMIRMAAQAALDELSQ